VLSDKLKLTKERLMNLNRFIKAVAATAGLALTSSLMTSIPPVLAARSGVDLDRYCKSMYATQRMAAWTQLNGRTVYDWSCAQRQPNGQVKQYGINMGHVCAVQRGTWDHNFTGRNNPYSWYCGR
jgi:hypothetical protein